MPIDTITNDILRWLLQLEDRSLSGKVVNLGDGAGFTRFGITTRDIGPTHPFFTWPVETAIAYAEAYYHKNFWLPLSLDTVIPVYAATILSCAVNCGLTAARALWDMSDSQSNFIDNWMRHYQAIVRHRPADLRFLPGWQARALCYYPELPE